MRRAAALLAALLAAWRSRRPAQPRRPRARPCGAAGALVEPERYDRPPAGRELSAREALAIAAAVPRIRAEVGEHRDGLRARLPRRAAAAGSCRGSCRRRAASPPRGDRPGARRATATGACSRRGPARRSMADGARLPGPVRARGQRAVGVDRAVPAVRAAVRAPAAAPAAPRPRGAAGLLGLLRVLRRGGARRLRAERLPAARLPAGADGDRRPAPARAAAAAADRARLPAPRRAPSCSPSGSRSTSSTAT